MTVGRILACIRCESVWDVVEIPEDFIDPERYVCPDCLRLIEGQLNLDDLEGHRVDEREYDPSIAQVPF